MRIIILQYSPTCAGIGDFLRSAGYLKKFCDDHEYSFYLDITNPIGAYFDSLRYTGTITDDTFIIPPERLKVTRELSQKEELRALLTDSDKNLLIRTNIVLDWTDLPHHVYNLRTILRPKHTLMDDLTSMFAQHELRATEYTAIHIRFGDNFLRTDKEIHWDDRTSLGTSSVDERIAQCLATVTTDHPIVLIADNYTEKMRIATSYGFKVFDIQPVHTSFCITDDIKNTLLEFLTLVNAKQVLAVSRSGFSRWAAAYGGVPYTCFE